MERELARNTTLEVNYIGTKSTHLLDRRNIAQPTGIPSASLAFCQEQNSAGTYININANPCARIYRNPYPNFNGTYINSDFHGYANYNAMNIKFEHRTHDLAATVIYTWAKSMDDKSAAAGVGATGSGYQGFMDNSRPQLDYAPSDFDVDHRFVASYVYQLPFGKGKKFAGTINRAGDLAVGGWQLSGITTFQTGFPFGIGGSDPQGLLDSGGNRAVYIQGCGRSTATSPSLSNASTLTASPTRFSASTVTPAATSSASPASTTGIWPSARTSPSSSGSSSSSRWIPSTPSTITNTVAT